MKNILWLLKWVLKAAIFFTLFAFALNNQQDTIVHFFFGNQWRAPQVLVVLSAFTLGVVVGVLGMVPWWWQQKQATKLHANVAGEPTANSTSRVATAPAYADGI
jgi:uncharacterized integral membrane protein